MTAFSIMRATVAADPHISTDATHTASVGGATTAVRAIWTRPTLSSGLGLTGPVRPERLVKVSIEQLASVIKGDTITIDGTAYTVQSIERPDHDAGYWHLGVRT